jgi:hypothetical protein
MYLSRRNFVCPCLKARSELVILTIIHVAVNSSLIYSAYGDAIVYWRLNNSCCAQYCIFVCSPWKSVECLNSWILLIKLPRFKKTLSKDSHVVLKARVKQMARNTKVHPSSHLANVRCDIPLVILFLLSFVYSLDYINIILMSFYFF